MLHYCTTVCSSHTFRDPSGDWDNLWTLDIVLYDIDLLYVELLLNMVSRLVMSSTEILAERIIKSKCLCINSLSATVSGVGFQLIKIYT